MVSNKVKLFVLKTFFKDSAGDISLKGLEAPELRFVFSDIKAKYIYNSCQKAEDIDNSYQEAKEINNSRQEADRWISNGRQKAELINNSRQIIADKKAKRIKELEEELRKLKNS